MLHKLISIHKEPTWRNLAVYTIWLSAEAIDLGRPYCILHPVSCHTPEAVTTVSKCSWGWRQKASETCRVLLQLLINILPSCITLVLYIYYISMYQVLFAWVKTTGALIWLFTSNVELKNTWSYTFTFLKYLIFWWLIKDSPFLWTYL